MGGQANIPIVETDDAKSFIDEELAKRIRPQDHLHRKAHDEQYRRITFVAKRFVMQRNCVGGDVRHKVSWFNR